MRLIRVTAALLVGLNAACMAPAHAEELELSSERIGDWVVLHLEDQVDDSTRWQATAVSNEGKGSLSLKCDRGGNEVYAVITFPEFVGGRPGDRAVTYRIDKNDPVKGHWKFNENEASYRYYGSVYDLVIGVRKGAMFRARSFVTEDRAVDVVVPVDGAEAALKKVYLGCGSNRWKN